MITVVCDSACDLWKDQVKELKVEVLQFPFLLDGHYNHHNTTCYHEDMQHAHVGKTCELEKLLQTLYNAVHVYAAYSITKIIFQLKTM